MFAYNHYTLTTNLQTDSKSLSKFIKIVVFETRTLQTITFSSFILWQICKRYRDKSKKFKVKVRFPKTIFKHTEDIDKNDIVHILNDMYAKNKK